METFIINTHTTTAPAKKRNSLIKHKLMFINAIKQRGLHQHCQFGMATYTRRNPQVDEKEPTE